MSRLRESNRYLILVVIAGLAIASAVLGDTEPSAGYDPASDPFADLESAKVEAQASDRHILLEVGGEWCGWCHLLEKFLHQHQEIARLWDAGFVTLKVNYSPENENEEFFSAYPEVAGYPHFFVLDAEGQLLHSQNTGELEQGKGYSRTLMKQFIERWGASNDTPATSH